MKTAVFLLVAIALSWAPYTARAADSSSVALGVPLQLTLDDAVRLALTASPRLQSLSWEIRKAEGRTRQAAARPNPELDFTVENVGGPAPSESEATLSLGQLLELGGKRSARVGAARAEQYVARQDLLAERLSVMGEVATRYIEALAADRLLTLADEEIREAQEVATTNAQRVRIGASHPVEQRRAEVDLANLRLEQVILSSDASLARVRLSSMWGETEPRFRALLGSLDSLPTVPDLASLTLQSESTFVLTRWRAEQEARRRRLDLERSRGVPDITALAGVRRHEDVSEPTFVGGLSMPLPLFNRNRGGVEEAAAALEQASSAEAQARLELRLALAERHATFRRARDKVDAIRRDVLPQAERAFEEMRLGYERGRFSYLDFLEARRTWLRSRREELQTLLAARLALADMERLVGSSLDSEGRLQR